jgi:hypothetical protein
MKIFVAIVLAIIGTIPTQALTQEEIFLRALKNNSTAPNFVVVQIKFSSGEWEERCTEAPYLLGALHREFDIPYTEEGVNKVMLMAVAASGKRRFVFNKNEAFKNLSVDYTKADLEKVASLISPLSLDEIRLHLNDDYFPKKLGSSERYWELSRAFAHAIIDRGLEVGRGCVSGNLYLGSATEPYTNGKEDRDRELATATMACRKLAAYDELQKSFRIESAALGYINSMPKSLFVELRSTSATTIDATWWWNPLVAEVPSLTWQDFLGAYAAAELAMSRHPWLTTLKKFDGDRSLELHLLGTGLGVSGDNLDNYILPAWRHAGMSGMPKYRLLVRRGKHSWMELFFSDEDPRAFVRSTSGMDPNPQCELDRLTVSWHPRGKRGETHSQYALIANDGGVQVQTFVMDEKQPNQP